jgi:hypothetical protein
MFKPLDAWDIETWKIYTRTYQSIFNESLPFPLEPWPGWVEEASRFKNKGLSPQEAVDKIDRRRL